VDDDGSCRAVTDEAAGAADPERRGPAERGAGERQGSRAQHSAGL
jgi:hypothetical protein